MKTLKNMGMLALASLLYYVVRTIVPSIQYAWACVKIGDWKWIPITIGSCLVACCVGYLLYRNNKSFMAIGCGILSFLGGMYFSCCVWHFQEFLNLFKEGQNLDILITIVVVLSIAGVLLFWENEKTRKTVDSNFQN